MENPLAPQMDGKLTMKTYHRTPQQNEALGLSQEDGMTTINEEDKLEEEQKEEEREGIIKKYSITEGRDEQNWNG